MPTPNSSFRSVLGNASAVSAAALLAAIETNLPYVVPDGSNPTSLTPGSITYILYGGRLFRYDAADSTTANDGVTCIVTADSKRFKADGYGGSLIRWFSTQSKTITAPPGSPTIGQNWIVAAGGTGAWAGKDTQIATWSARGWLFTAPNTNDIALNAADSQLYYFNASNVWTAGLPGSTFGNDIISPRSLKYAKFGLSVINQTTTAPPGSPSDGDAYVIGASATGAWTGKDRQIAIYEVSAWQYYAPYNGAEVYDANLGANIIYRTTSNTWTQQSGYASIQIGSKSGNLTATPNYAYSTGTAPTTSNTTSAQLATYAAKKAGATLEVEVDVQSFTGQAASNSVFSLGVFIDGAASAADWTAFAPMTGAAALYAGGIVKFYITAPNDTSNHTYTVRYGAGAASVVGLFGVRIVIRELA